MANAENPLILISKNDGEWCAHSTDNSGTAYSLTVADDKPERTGCITKVSKDREYTTCECGLFVWKRVEPIELFQAIPPELSQAVGNHLAPTDKQRRYIRVLMAKLDHRLDIDDDLVRKAYNMPVSNRGEASKLIDFVKGLLGE